MLSIASCVLSTNDVQVMVPMMGNEKNHMKWPNVVSQDMMKHTGGLKGDVQVLSGQVKGKTFLPLPPQGVEVAEAYDMEKM